MKIKEKMRQLIERLQAAEKAYYGENREIMSNREYDALYDELAALEEESGIIFSNSPTRKVGHVLAEFLPKVAHERPMLSLDKTKDVHALQAWLGNNRGVLSWKLDGLTIVLTYRKGHLVSGVTRGNGTVGEEITENVKAFENIPLRISYAGDLVIRGEAVIGYEDFAAINEAIPEEQARYKNPRNLCSGSVRQLNPAVTARRHVRFFAFHLWREKEGSNSFTEELKFLSEQGFDVVGHRPVTGETLEESVSYFTEALLGNDIPCDGLVLTLDDIAYGESLGSTEKFPRNSIAYKWQDETKETTLLHVEWSASRTGLINPVAVFEPVELEGTSVSRASVHNLSILEGLRLGAGDRIEVYKANMIIPQIAGNLTRSGSIAVLDHCPVCGERTQIKNDKGVKTLYCVNPACPVKHTKGIALFVSRDGLNMEGLSQMTLEKLMGAGLVREAADLFFLDRHREAILSMAGFGPRSLERLLSSVDKSRNTTLPRLLYGLGIAGIGLANAKALSAHFGEDLSRIASATRQELMEVEGIGEILAEGIAAYFASPQNRAGLDRLVKELNIKKEMGESRGAALSGKRLAITGSLHRFSGRKGLEAYIESLGGTVSSSVSVKTDYLINNDNASASSKNKKAKELGVSIITEEEFLSLFSPGRLSNPHTDNDGALAPERK